MNEDVFSRLALDEPVALGRVKPLHHTLFSAQLRTPRSERSPFAGCNARRWDGKPGTMGFRTTTELRDPQTRRHAGTNSSACPESFAGEKTAHVQLGVLRGMRPGYRGARPGSIISNGRFRFGKGATSWP